MLTGDIRTGFDGFGSLTAFNTILQMDDSSFYKLNMSRLKWLDANLCAPLGAILRLAENSGKQIICDEQSIPSIFGRNNFLSNFGGPKRVDHYDTTIEYRHFEKLKNGSNQFQEYVGHHFKNNAKGLPAMSQALLKRFRESLFEIFENAIEHSSSQLGVFACGQYFPKLD